MKQQVSVQTKAYARHPGFLLTLTLVFIFCGFTEAQSQSASGIEGVWGVDIDETISRMEIGNDRQLSDLPAHARESFKEGFSDRKFFFEPANKMTLRLTIRDSVKELTGEWNYDAQSNELLMTINDKPQRFKVQWESHHSMVLDFDKRPDDKGLVKFLCLKRIN